MRLRVLEEEEKRPFALEEIVVGRDDTDMKMYGKKGTVLIGKHIVGTGEDAHTTTPLLLDVLRPHLMMITGKRGSGKCLHEDTLITLEDGACVPIKDLENDNRGIVCLNDDLKMQKSDKVGFYKREVDKIIHLRLRSGREIKLTPEHPLLTVKGWKPLNELSIGSRIATPRVLPETSASQIPEHEIKLLAYLIAEGHTATHYVLFSNMDKAIINDFRDAMNRFDSNLKMSKRQVGHYQISQINKIVKSSVYVKDSKGRFIKGSGIRYDKNAIAKWFSRLGIYGRLSKDKFIPQEIMKLDSKGVSLFLNRLFSCDGSIYKTADWQISYSSSSEQLIHQVQHLLLTFGILSKIRKRRMKLNGKEFESFEIVINGEFVQRFINEIGFFGKKEERQKIALSDNKKRNPNVDTVPKDIWDIYKPNNWAAVGRYFGYKYPKAMRESMDYSPSRQKLLYIADYEQNNALRLLAESDIFWDEIVSMELLEGTFTVYDITVPEHHNFVANDIIVHNSYLLADIVEEFAKLPEDVKDNLCALMIDTQGIFWTMKSPNEQELVELKEWGLKPRGFPVYVYIPEGQEKTFSSAGVDYDETFAVAPYELSINDWLDVFALKQTETAGILLQRAIVKMQGRDYSIDDVIQILENEKTFVSEKLALQNILEAAKEWGIFGTTRMPEILVPGKVSIIDLSLTPDTVRALLISLVFGKIFYERTEARRKEELAAIDITTTYKRTPMPWLLIDEAHNFLPNAGRTAATDVLMKIVKEGRQPGITLVFATQQPEKLHQDALSQCDIIISHRLTAKQDVEALKSIMQTYMLFDITRYINELPKIKGVAIILDDNSERIYKARIRPRQSWHAGSSPVAL